MSHSGAIRIFLRFALATLVAVNCCFCTGGKIQAVGDPSDLPSALGQQVPSSTDAPMPGETGKQNFLQNNAFASGQIDPWYTAGSPQIQVIAPEVAGQTSYVAQISGAPGGSLNQDLQCTDIPGGCEGKLDWGVTASGSGSVVSALLFLDGNGLVISQSSLTIQLSATPATFLSNQAAFNSTATVPVGTKLIRYQLTPSGSCFVSGAGVFTSN